MLFIYTTTTNITTKYGNRLFNQMNALSASQPTTQKHEGRDQMN